MSDKWRTVRNLERSGKIDRDDLKTTVRTYHVLPDGTNGWAVRKPGNRRSYRRFSSQDEAIRYAKEFARSIDAGKIVVHSRDGRVLREDSYDRDWMSDTKYSI